MEQKRLIFFCAILLSLSNVEETNSLSVECWFGDSSSWTVLDKGYACVVYNIQGEENVRENLTKVTGSPRDGTTYNDIKVFDIRGFCNFIPSGIDKFFPNIEGFSSYNTSMLTVSSEDLKQFPKLRELWIYFNLLEYLPSNLFQHNPNVEFVHLHKNKIKFIGPEFFNYLPKLYGAKLSGNVCIERNVYNVKKLILLKREIKKKCSSETGPSEASNEVTSLQIDYLYRKIARLEKEIKDLEDSSKLKCD